MYVDIQSLGTFSRLASQGADRAADSLSQLTGASVYVDVTDVTLMAAGDLREAFADREFVGVEIGLTGGIAGQTVMAFERGAANELVSRLMPGAGDDPEYVRSGVTEAGNILTSGFIDGWADHLGVAIDMTPPSYVRASGVEVLPDGAFDDDRSGVFLFESRVSAMDSELDLTIYMLPEYSGFTDLLGHEDERAAAAGEAVPVDKLPAFSRMTRRGAASAAEKVTMMTGTETAVDVSRIRFVPVGDVPSEVGDETLAGTVFELHGEPSGYLAVLFDESSAERVAGSMIPTETDDGIGEMERGALRELGNIVTSGFIDGWANVLGTSIEHTPPQFVHDMGSAVMSPLVSDLGRTQDHAFIIDSTVRTPDGDVRCDIYALPDQRELAAALDRIDPAVADGGHGPAGSDDVR
ncbi:chemotaxis protein CheC [Halorarum salinum]|uniref:Chemotaxis protein CheC n=1 Tax=Halorarum salinum TaxID=2743089 RepID=A0A7D5Q9Z2_9EURY|nr:chemotaxis protein CheC [Halobaculum salinum]QLG61019.1 chemotaxis protein CheC [Halobaculum salinum]